MRARSRLWVLILLALQSQAIKARAAEAPAPLTTTPAPAPPPIPSAVIPATLTATVSELRVILPEAPRGFEARFALDLPERLGKPTSVLSWEGAQANTFLIKNFRVLRKGPGEDVLHPIGVALASSVTLSVDAVEIGKTYEYSLIAIDVKGNSSEAAAPRVLDLTALEPALLAPRSPQGLTASSQRAAVRLQWSPPSAWYQPVSSYQVLRNDQPLASGITQTSYDDLSPTPKTLFSYRVQALDTQGRLSAPDVTVTGQATGTLAPGAPGELSANAKTEKVVLSWVPSQPGTSPVSSYVITRVTEPGPDDKKVGEVTKRFRPLAPSKTSFTDSVDGDHNYRYEILAVDSEGNSSQASSLRTWVDSKPFNKTAILLMPTAYSNNVGRDRGANINVLFDFYVGSLYDTFYDEHLQRQNSGVFQPLQIGTVSGDLKYSLWEETWIVPALAVGFYGTAIINFTSPDSAQSVGVSTSGAGIATLGDLYVVASKRFGRRSAFHLGAMRGKLSDDLAALAPPDWGPTLRHLTPGDDFPALLNRFLDPKLGAEVRSSPHLIFTGLQFPFTLPIGKGWKSGLKIEALMPVFPEDPPPSGEPISRVRDLLPLMVNFHLDNLPLFGFEFSVFKFLHGWGLVAFYHIPDLTWSW